MRLVFIFHAALLQLVAINRVAIFVPRDDLVSIVSRLRGHRHRGQKGRDERGNA